MLTYELIERVRAVAQVMLAFDTAARLATPTNALHPGTFLDTGMVRESGITPLGTAAARRELFARSRELVQRFIARSAAARATQ